MSKLCSVTIVLCKVYKEEIAIVIERSVKLQWFEYSRESVVQTFFHCFLLPRFESH